MSAYSHQERRRIGSTLRRIAYLKECLAAEPNHHYFREELAALCWLREVVEAARGPWPVEDAVVAKAARSRPRGERGS